MAQVSVIIPTYNHGDTIKRAVDSALSQTINSIEVLVVDDGSTDRTESQMEIYEDTDNVRYIQHKENKSASAALNTGIEEAVGKYIARLDADDRWLPSKLERQLTHIDDNSTECIGCYCDFFYRDESHPTVILYLMELLNRLFPNWRTHPEDPDKVIHDILTLRASIAGSTLLLERDYVERVGGYDQRYERHTDWELLLRMIKYNKILYLDEQLVERLVSDPPDPKLIEEMKQQLFDDFETEIKNLKSNGVNVKNYHQFSLGKKYIRNGELHRGINYIRCGSPNNLPDYMELVFAILSGLRSKWT